MPIIRMNLIKVLLVVFLIGIIGAIALPNILASRRSANGAHAIEAMRLIHSTEMTYIASMGKNNFASADELFYYDYIQPELASAITPYPIRMVSKSGATLLPKGSEYFGYYYKLKPTSATPQTKATFDSYAVPVRQVGILRTGDRAFLIDETGVIRASIQADIIPDKFSTALCN